MIACARLVWPVWRFPFSLTAFFLFIFFLCVFFFLSVDSTSVRLDGWNYLSWNTISLTIEYFIIQVQCTEKASWFPAVITYGEKNISSIGNFPLVCHKMSSIMKTTANAIKTTSTEYQLYCRRRSFYYVRWFVRSFWSVFFPLFSTKLFGSVLCHC